MSRNMAFLLIERIDRVESQLFALEKMESKYFAGSEAIKATSMETKGATEECQEAVAVSAMEAADKAVAADYISKSWLNSKMNRN